MFFCALLLVFVMLPFATEAQSEVDGAVAGVVFLDEDGDGRRGPGEAGVAGVTVCTRARCSQTDPEGLYEVPVSRGDLIVWFRQGGGYRAARQFWRRIPADPFEWLVNLAVERADEPTDGFRFLHASDTHLDEESLPRFRRMREIAEEQDVDFVLITGDLIRDALRVPAEVANERYRLFVEELGEFSMPVHVVPGNHENFGIERDQSGVSEDHPLYGKTMYRRYLGPTYYSFDHGGFHFVGLDTVDIADQVYYAHVDPTQLSWLEEDLSTVPADTPIVTFNHIPLFSAVIHGWGYYPDGGSLLEVDGKAQLRHMVSNYAEVLAKLEGRRYPLALGGHGHAREEILLGDRKFTTRFHQASAVVGDAGEREGMQYESGVTLYRVRDGGIEGWEFLPIDGP